MSEVDKKSKVRGKKLPLKKILLLVIPFLVVLLLIVATIVIKPLKERLWSIYLSKVLSKSTEANVVVGGGGKDIDYQDGENSYTYKEGKLPQDFPVDFPIYPIATLQNSWSTDEADTKGMSVIWQSNDEMQTITQYFKEEIPKAGYDITASFEQDDSNTLTFEKDATSGFVGVTPNPDGGVIISLTLGIK